MTRAARSTTGLWAACALLAGGCELPPPPGSAYDVPDGATALDARSPPEDAITPDTASPPDLLVPPDSLACPTPQERCGGVCVDTRSALAHCGACGNACPSGQVCSTSACRVSCTGGTLNCGGVCRDTQTDRLHCGACGSACPSGQICAAGRCELSCPAGQSACGTTCHTLATDASHCGRCANACAAGQSCVGGACTGGATLTQRSCAGTPTPAGCGLVSLTGGSFTMGEASPAYNASPLQMNVRVSNFAIDAFEVTVARFRMWVTAGQPTPSGPVMYRGGPMAFEGTINSEMELNCDPSRANYRAARDREDHPINCVNWATAQAFCVWDGGRLPTQAEWEFAARGSSGRVYPWGGATGDTPTNAQACWSGAGMSRSSTCTVGSLRAGDTPDGVHDLAGNVYEWKADWYADYRSMAPGCWVNNGPIDPICTDRATGYSVIRGGSWNNTYAAPLRAASRIFNTPANRDIILGFRCARDTP